MSSPISFRFSFYNPIKHGLVAEGTTEQLPFDYFHGDAALIYTGNLYEFMDVFGPVFKAVYVLDLF